MVVVLIGIYYCFCDKNSRENLCKTEGLGKGGEGRTGEWVFSINCFHF
jgi:hypothetical protein